MVCLTTGRFFLPTGPNYTGENSGITTYIGYMFENFALFVSTVVFFKKYAKAKYFSEPGVVLWLSFYIYVVVLSITSHNPVLSMHMGLRGLCYVILGMLIFHYIKTSSNESNSFHQFLSLSFWGMVVVIIAETVTTISLDYVLNFGVGGSFIGLMGLIYLYSLYKMYRNEEKSVINRVVFILQSIVVLFIVVKINSFSSILTFVFSLIALLLLKFNKKFIIILILSLVILYNYSPLELLDSNFRIANKSIDVLLSGSGRFQTWKVCFDIFSNFDYPLYGVGFLSDGVVLEDKKGILELTHSCHSSTLSNFIGLGVFGLVFYIAFFGIHVLQILFPKNDEYRDFTVLILLSLLLFGFGSVIYPGSPTVLISYSVVIFLLNAKE